MLSKHGMQGFVLFLPFSFVSFCFLNVYIVIVQHFAVIAEYPDAQVLDRRVVEKHESK